MLILDAEKIYQLIFIAISGLGSSPAADDLSNIYFGSADQMAKEYGVRLVETFDIVEIEHGDFDADTAIVLEWGSLEELQQFEDSEVWVIAQHDRIGSYHSVTFKVGETTGIALNADGLYEFAGFWMNRHNATLMPQYMQGMGPVVKEARPAPLARIEVIHVRSPYDLAPDRLNLLQWRGGANAREAMFKSKEFRENGYLRALAVDRLLTIMVQPR